MKSYKPLVLWTFCTLFFAFQFILRLSVGILREDIIQRFAIDTAAFGTLAGYYYLGYAGMQIPLGIMLDRFNFKNVTFLSIVITSIGTLAFVVSKDWHVLLAARFIIGAGSAIGILSVAKVIKTYFAPEKHSLMIGFSFTFGLTGAVFGVTPMKLIFNHFGYDNTFYGLALVGIAIGFAILMMNFTAIEPYEDQPNSSSNFKQILKFLCNPMILLVGLFSGLMVGSLEGFGDVWAISFFKVAYNMNSLDSNLATSCIYLGMCFGGPVLAVLADFFKSTNSIILLTGLFMTIIFIILLTVPSLSFLATSVIMFLLGIFCCYQVLILSITNRIVEKSMAGLAIATVNCINMSFGHFFHKAMSIFIEYRWDGTTENGLPIYIRQNYFDAIICIPICCLIGTGGFIWLSKKLKSKDSFVNSSLAK
ncbi:MAG: MFS transporter [Rickettsiaceae bacterium]|nr:MAG: MFS transporter [Rickettsiaceae bacterium]